MIVLKDFPALLEKITIEKQMIDSMSHQTKKTVVLIFETK